MRLIDVDALMPLFIEKAYTMKDRHGVKLGEEWLLNYNDIQEVIDNAPIVCNDNYSMGYQDGVKKVLSERPTGEWIDEGQYAEGHSEHYYRCSECGGHIIELRVDDFCKHCGADMRGGR